MKIKLMLKKILIHTLVITSLLTATLNLIPLAKAASQDILGTNAALGSPVLNENFVIDDWNKWEFVCWGVYLSNFCVPLIDDYNSAFKEGAGGSNGRGYKALCFGSGSDESNNDVIEALCDEAILNQMTSPKEIFVRYGGYYDTEITDSSSLRTANFQDLFFQIPYDSIDTENATYGATTWNEPRFDIPGLDWISGPVGLWANAVNYTDMAIPAFVNIPTFYIKKLDGTFVKIFDYRNSWDLQIIGAILNAIPKECEDEFQNAFEDLWESNPRLQLDSFANITTGGKVIIPASCNQYITKTESINILNSFIFNSYITTTTDTDLILGLRQLSTNTFTTDQIDANRVSGIPAINETNIGNIGLLFFDTDTIVMQDYLTKGNEEVNYGDVLAKLFSCDIKNNINVYPIKFEIAGGTTESLSFKKFSSNKYSDILNNTRVMASSLANIVAGNNTQTTQYLSEIILPDGTRTKDIFSSEPVVIANQFLLGDGKEPSEAGALRHFYNFLYDMYKTKNSELDVETGLKGITTPEDLHTFANNHWDLFQKHYSKYNNTELPKDNSWGVFDYAKSFLNAITKDDTVDAKAILDNTSRAILAYPVSPIMKQVSEVMALTDGVEFKTYCSYIYMTYLDWYGIGAALSSGNNNFSKFNPDIFDAGSSVISINIQEVIPNIKTKEDKEQEVLELGLLMLQPADGREYRKKLIYNSLEDFLFEQYNRIVYGGKDSMYNGIASKSNSGFLAVETYESNPLTSFVLESYVDFVIWASAIVVLLIIIMCILKKKGISWAIVNLIIAINVILIVPSSGEIVPYLTSKFVQNTFDSKMTYWSISEAVTNARIESDTVSSTVENDGLSQQDAEIVLKIVNALNVVNTDRSLMIKQDISQKVTQKLDGIYSDIQKIQSARWLLPIVMEQFSGEGKSTEYLYIKLGNLWTDMSNFYWYYNPDDTEYVSKQTITSGQADASICTNRPLLNQIMPLDSHELNKYNDWNFRSVSYDYSNESGYFDNHNQTHQIAYMMENLDCILPSRRDTNVFGADGSGYENEDSWQKYIDYAKISITNPNLWHTDLDTNKQGLELVADQYSRYSRNTIDDNMSYLKHTETPAYYFYNVVKDSINGYGNEYASKSYSKFVSDLQGNIKVNNNGEQVRNSFMHATIGNKYSEEQGNMQYTGYVRDILDLQELFEHTIPYLYQVQLITGGFDGKSGILGDAIIKDNDYYEGQLQSWLYRCNWATKIMENPEYSKPTTVRDADGNEYKISNPLLWECYPTNRPMIFSEAQMHAYGLRESYLNLVELKCIEVNKKTCEKWTLLLNYINTPGINKEIMARQMATDATMVFNEEFSTSGILNNLYKLYPTSIDLRYMSFDSIMKMIMLNVSKNTSYVYGTTMQTLISDSDLFTAFLLLIAAILCAWVVPGTRMLLMAAIFYLGFVSILRSIFSSSKTKAGIAASQFVTNILFMVYTCIYYAGFALIMAVTSNDELLSVNNIHSNPGNPVWALLVVIALSGLYVYVMIKQLLFCKNNYRDMGQTVYGMIAHSIGDKITDKLDKISSKLYDWTSGYSSTSVGGTGNTNSIKGTGAMDSSVQEVKIRGADDSALRIENSETIETKQNDIAQQSYSNGDTNEYRETTTSADINAQIEAGKNM